MRIMIYLDNNATTPVDPAVLEAMLPFLREQYANASSGYTFSRPVKKAVIRAREQVAALAGCEPEEVIFTSGGTEADNAALLSAVQVFLERKHLIISAAEHEAVLNCAAWLERTHGYKITRLSVDAQGRTDIAELAAAIRPGQTAVIALMLANNETGVLAPVAEAAALAAAHGVLFHTDAVQAAGKMPLQFQECGVHTMALSGHKFHAPKGIGVLIASSRVAFQASLHGGGQENGRRSGTENVPGIVALGAAAELALQHLESTARFVRTLRDHFETEAIRRIPRLKINGLDVPRIPNTSSLRIAGVEAQALILLLDQRGICVSSGSACSTGSLYPSHVLSAMGLTATEARSVLRISFSRFNTMEETTAAVDALVAAVQKFRSLMPGNFSA